MPDDTTRATDTTGTDIAQVNNLTGLISRAAAALTRAMTAAEVLDVVTHAIAAYDIARTTARLIKARHAHAEIIAACHKAQADALEIEAAAQCRLADEYDAAQARGEIATHSAGNPQIIRNTDDLPHTAAEVGLSNRIVHEARKVRDAERENPGIVRKTLGERLQRGEAPTRADIKRAITPKRTAATAPSTVAPGVVPPEPAADDDEPWCCFCGRCSSEVGLLISANEIDGPGPYICDECVSNCVTVIERWQDERRGRGAIFGRTGTVTAPKPASK